MSLGKSNLWVFFLGSGPVFVVSVFLLLLRCFLWRNASLAGEFAGRRVCRFLWFLWVVGSFDLPAQNGHFLSLYKCLSDSLCSCKDRAFSATSAKLEEKKSHVLSTFLGPVCRKSAVHRSAVRSNASSKIPTELRRRTRTSTTHTKHKRSA